MLFLFALGFVHLFQYLPSLEGPDSPEREAAIGALADSAQVSDLGDALYRTNWRGREGILSALERKQSESLPVLMHTARAHSRLDARRLAILSLGRVNHPAARDSLVRLLSGSERDIALEALGEVGDSTVTEAIVGFLSDPVPDVRRRAVVALAKVAGKSAAEHVVPLLSDGHHSVRFATAGVLEGLGETAGDDLMAHFDRLSNPGKYLAVRTLGRIGYGPASDLLRRVLAGNDWALRGIAAEVLGLFSGNRAFLKDILKAETHPFVREQILRALKHSGSD